MTGRQDWFGEFRGSCRSCHQFVLIMQFLRTARTAVWFEVFSTFHSLQIGNQQMLLDSWLVYLWIETAIV